MFDVIGDEDQVMLCLDQDDTDVRRQKGEAVRSIGLHVFKVIKTHRLNSLRCNISSLN